MKVPKEGQGIGVFLLPILEKLPVLSYYAKTRGWFYVISWLRGEGIFPRHLAGFQRKQVHRRPGQGVPLRA